MLKPLQIKICGMRCPQNILAVDALQPDYLGMIFYQNSPRNMDKKPDAIPETNAQKVGVFVDADREVILNKAHEYKFNTLQLHGNESPEMCANLMQLGYRVFKAFSVDADTRVGMLQPYAGMVTAFLFDTKTVLAGGSGKKFNWKILDELAAVYPFFLSGGISMRDITEIKSMQYPNLLGIDLNSKFELEPGIKDVALLNEFMLRIRS